MTKGLRASVLALSSREEVRRMSLPNFVVSLSAAQRLKTSRAGRHSSLSLFFTPHTSTSMFVKLTVVVTSLLLVPGALASPIASPRAVSLDGRSVELFPGGVFDAEIAKRDACFALEKYKNRDAQLSRKVKNKKKRSVGSVPLTSLVQGGVDVLVSSKALELSDLLSLTLQSLAVPWRALDWHASSNVA